MMRRYFITISIMFLAVMLALMLRILRLVTAG